jgi:Uma2 family endonuclease
MPTTLRKPVSIGPKDHGRRMSVDRFDRAIAPEGRVFELNKGVIEMVDVPDFQHFRHLQPLRDQLTLYKEAHPDAIVAITGGMESKLLVASTQSERHPDLSVYLTSPPEVDDIWSIWVPEIVVEVVSARSSKRDYGDKPQDYLEFGIREYWIIDGPKQQMTAMIRWQGKWKSKVLKPSQKYATTLLPGFSLDLGKVLSTR